MAVRIRRKKKALSWREQREVMFKNSPHGPLDFPGSWRDNYPTYEYENQDNEAMLTRAIFRIAHPEHP